MARDWKKGEPSEVSTCKRRESNARLKTEKKKSPKKGRKTLRDLQAGNRKQEEVWDGIRRF